MNSRRLSFKTWSFFDLPTKEKEITSLEQELNKPNVWQEPQRAQGLAQRLSETKRLVGLWRGLEKKIEDLEEVLALAYQEEDEELIGDVGKELEKLAAEIRKHELEIALSGPYDSRNALLAIHAGAGGTESQDWAEMLLRMYLRWAENRHFKTSILDISPGEEAGIKSSMVLVEGEYAYGYLKSEHGVHRLVRLSPFDADHARHTSFALLEVMPEFEDDTSVKVSPDDLKIETFLSSGPGGQHMQKSSTAVRITHLPTGISVSCQSERSQYLNKENALKVLYARLLQLEIAKKEEEKARLKGDHVEMAWGNQIRSYVLHPYKLVKDHRTGYETSRAEAVLEGELDEFIDAYLRKSMGKNEEINS